MSSKKTLFFCLVPLLLSPCFLRAQLVNSGSDGRDGDLRVGFGQTMIDMSDHPDGIYRYKSVDIGFQNSIIFKPNKSNSPLIWLIQGDCNIGGDIYLGGGGGNSGVNSAGGSSGPGGFPGGGGGTQGRDGSGPGGGKGGTSGGGGGYATKGDNNPPDFGGVYGNEFVFPLIGGSGGGGARGENPTPSNFSGGGGGGGAILIVASGAIRFSGGTIYANGGPAGGYNAGCGSGGAVRLVASSISGGGGIHAQGGSGVGLKGGDGRVRLDSPDDQFSGTALGALTRGFQPIILPPGSSAARLQISSIAGAAISDNPSSSAYSPEVVISAQVNNPVPVLVRCFNIPLNTSISVGANTLAGQMIQAGSLNTAGSLAESVATINLNLPRGSGTLMARARIAIGSGEPPGLGEASVRSGGSIGETGLTADGERIVEVVVESILGGGSRQIYVTESGKRIPAPPTK